MVGIILVANFDPNSEQPGLHDWHGLSLIRTLISNNIHYKIPDAISYAFPNVNGAPLDM